MANATKNEGPLQPLIDLVPDNIFKSSSDNRNMLQVIFFAVLFTNARLFPMTIHIIPTIKTTKIKAINNVL